MADLTDLYCIKVRRFGALGTEEQAGAISSHEIEHADVEDVLDLLLGTMGPGDRAVVEITRGDGG